MKQHALHVGHDLNIDHIRSRSRNRTWVPTVSS
jgi:hypothetical protein